jgi:hypothetical protein
VTFVLELPEDLVEVLAQRAADLIRRDRRFLSKAALAERYGVAERTIKTWREKGLPGVRVGREVMYDVDACDRWIEAQG